MRFAFGTLEVGLSDDWAGVDWDASPAYDEGIKKLQGTAALDLVAVRAHDTVVYMEVKDYRGHAIEHAAELTDGSLAHWVARKVRDTLAGLLAAHARTKPRHEWKSFATAPSVAANVVVLFWVECSPGWARKPESKALLSTLTSRLQRELSWFTRKVHVVADSGSNPLHEAGIQLHPLAPLPRNTTQSLPRRMRR